MTSTAKSQISKLFDIMQTSNKEFADTGRFKTLQIVDVCLNNGMPKKVADAAMRSSTKIGRGLYEKRKLSNVKQVTVKKAVVPTPVVLEMYKSNVVEMPATRKEAVQRVNDFATVPPIYKDYVPFGDYKDIEKIISSKIFYPVMICGHSGNGKTMSVTQACAKLNRPMIRINCTKKTDEEVLIGSKTLIDGNIQVVEGPMLIAMRSGAVIILDEVAACDVNAILCIQGILEGGSFYFPLTGETIYPASGFNIFFCDNTKGQGSDDGKYLGTSILNEAFLERVGMVIEQDFPSMQVEKKIITRRMETKNCVDETFANDLVKWADAIRRTFKDGGIDSVISTRRLGHIIDNYSIFGDKKKAIVQCVARFDEMTKNALVSLWDKIVVEPVPEVLEDNLEPIHAI